MLKTNDFTICHDVRKKQNAFMSNVCLKSKPDNNVVWHQTAINRCDREKLNGHESFVLWFTGLSCSGKSTIANAAAEILHKMGNRTYVLDGDNIRHGLCSDIGFSSQDRAENIRRIGEVVKLFVDAGVIALTAFISPFKSDREKVRRLISKEAFFEIHCRCPLHICEQRDVKGMYKRARAGEIKEYTGISSPYEEPEHPDIILDTDICSVDECAKKIIKFLVKKKKIKHLEP